MLFLDGEFRGGHRLFVLGFIPRARHQVELSQNMHWDPPLAPRTLDPERCTVVVDSTGDVCMVDLEPAMAEIGDDTTKWPFLHEVVKKIGSERFALTELLAYFPPKLHGHRADAQRFFKGLVWRLGSLVEATFMKQLWLELQSFEGGGHRRRTHT